MLAEDPALHAIEGFVLTFVTGMMLVYFLVFLFATWADREYVVGRDDDGRPRPAREVHPSATRKRNP